MINLSNAQSNIVYASIEQPIQVLASAGSGKTRVLTERIRHIIESTRKDGVIAITFTNKAAEEMLGRLDGLEDVNERCWIATIHSVAQRILDQYGHTIGLPSELHIYENEQDRKSVFLQSLRENGVDIDAFLATSNEKEKRSRERLIQTYMSQFSVVKRELFTEDEIKERYKSNKNFWQIYQAYQEALLEGGGIDFDDILVYAHRILLEQPWCGQIYRAKYKHICVDEAQDLNKSQYEFIKTLCGDQILSLMMVGDPNQMIYGFNGSSHVYLCQQFVDDFSPAKFELRENYRSSKAVIDLANKLKPSSQIEAVFALNGKSYIEGYPNEEEEALWINNKITELLQLKKHSDIEGEITLEKMVVIARNRFVFQTLEKTLKNNQIPYSLKKGERHLPPSSIFGQLLELSIRFRLNSKDWVAGKKICGILKLEPPDIWGNENLLQKFADDTRNSDIPFPLLQSDLLTAIQNIDLEQPKIPKLFNELSKSIEDLTIDNEQDNELERSLQELQDFRNQWTRFKKQGLGNSLFAFRNAIALGQLVENYDSTGLLLSTVHTMKGLEKDIVFLMGMCEGVFPDYRASTTQEINEERNNAFVAVTRARRWLYITFPKLRKMPWGSTKRQNPSRFLKEMDSLN